MNEFIENWAELEFSDVVRLYRKGELLATGIVDGVMPDGSAVCLIQGTFFGRALYLKSDGANKVRVDREDLPTGYIISTKK